VLCIALGLAVNGWFSGSGPITGNDGGTGQGKPASTVPNPEELPTGTKDLLRQKPRELIFEDLDPQSLFAYSENSRRLTIQSMHWSAFVCGKHSGDFRLDIAMLHGEPPAHAGAFWGLHPESASDGLSRETCLAVVIQREGGPKNASVHLYRLLIGDDIRGKRAIVFSAELANVPAEVDWSKAVDLQIPVSGGKSDGVTLQGQRVPLLPAEPTAEWKATEWKDYSSGECGLISDHATHQVVFTRALFQSPSR
jgi:hypothetical protein